MNWKQLSLVAIGFTSGFLLAALIYQNRADVPVGSVSNTARTESSGLMRADYERQIAYLESELEVARSKATSGEGNLRAGQTFAERRAVRDETLLKVLRTAQRVETDKLLAAGFTMDRIEWIRTRAEELKAQYRQDQNRLEQQGQLGQAYMDAVVAHSHDSDIDLHRELGADEYARYRQAVGRPIGASIAQVQAGGAGHAAGLQPGDEIVAYNGIRVFNVGELNPLVRKYATAGSNYIDVLRNGQTIRLGVAGGSLGITSPLALQLTEDRLSEVQDRVTKEIRKARESEKNATSK